MPAVAESVLNELPPSAPAILADVERQARAEAPSEKVAVIAVAAALAAEVENLRDAAVLRKRITEIASKAG